MAATVSVLWDSAPVRQSFGACHVVFDGVATLADGRTFRVNVTATRGARKPESILRYMTDAKRGHAVPESMLADVRAEIALAATQHLKPMRDAIIAAARDADAAEIVSPATLPELIADALPTVDAGDVIAVDGIESGLTGDDWEPTPATRFYAQRLGNPKGGPFAFGATRADAIAALAPACPACGGTEPDCGGLFCPVADSYSDKWADACRAINRACDRAGCDADELPPFADSYVERVRQHLARPIPRFVVAVAGGRALLCEGGVYSTRPQGEYAANTLAKADRDAAEYNATYDSRYEVRGTLEGVEVESEIAASLESWQLEIVERQPIGLMSLGAVRAAARRIAGERA